MHKIIGLFLATVLVSAVGFAAFGQATRSPFTSQGLGDLADLSLAHNQGSAGLGISNGNYLNLNNLNPALLAYNSLTVFSAGFIGTKRSVTNGSLTEDYTGGNLNYLVTAFPAVAGRWTTSIGLMPYSSVNYDFSYLGEVTGSGDLVEIREQGSGGINQISWSNGVAINKNIFVGLKASYLFSGFEKEFSNYILDVGPVDIPIVKDRITVSDFILSSGLAFNLDSIFNSPVKFKFGLTYDLATDIDSKRFQSFERFDVNRGFDSSIAIDTLIDNQTGSIGIPEAVGVGVSFNKDFNWTVGMDIKYQKWSNYTDFNGTNDVYDDSFKATLGGEFTIDPSSVTSYFKRITFRLGTSYEETPHVINNFGEMSQVKDFGINFGWSLPVSKLSSFDMAFRYGKRGNVEETILEENYYKIYLGITFNDRWFIKRKYD